MPAIKGLAHSSQADESRVLTDPTTSLPVFCRDFPGLGGGIKRFNEDFVVEELPLYEFSGTGTHAYLQIEKQGMTTQAAIRLLGRSLGRPARDFGYAGMKDAHGITTQWISVEHVRPERLVDLDLGGKLRVVQFTRHSNKLKLGHLSGNRFTVKLRDFDPDPPGALTTAVEILDRLTRFGVPNYFGPQRFGARGNNAQIGRAVIVGDFREAISRLLGRPGPKDHGPARTARERFESGDYSAAALNWRRVAPEYARLCRSLTRQSIDWGRAWRSLDQSLRRLLVSALQSDLFNQVVARRMDSIGQAMSGDLAWIHRNGACFRVIDAGKEQARCTDFEISPTGPLYGRRMSPAEGDPGRIEEVVLRESGLTPDQLLDNGADGLTGGRRPLRVPLRDSSVSGGSDDHGPFLLFSFSLPAGAYATSVMREFTLSR